MPVDNIDRALDLVAGAVDETQPTERAGRGFFQTVRRDVDQLEAPPPISPAMPSASTKPIMMPCAASRASFSPDSTSIARRARVLVVKIFGEDLDQLSDYANRVGKIVKGITGTAMYMWRRLQVCHKLL